MNSGQKSIDKDDYYKQILKGGRHLIAEFYNCQCADEIICQAAKILPVMREAIGQVGLTIVGEAVHEFSPLPKNIENNDLSPNIQTSGCTISVLLAESHICVHTWGELKTVTLDIYVCNFLQDNSEKADNLLEACRELFQPMEVDMKALWRTHNQKITS